METTNIVDFARRDGITDALTDLLRSGAQQLIATPVEAELAGYLAQFSDVRTEAGHAAVVRNGHHSTRPFQTGIGPVSVQIPKVRSKDGTIPLGPTATRCAPHQDLGSSFALAVYKGDFQWRDGRGPQGSSWSRCRWPISEYGLTP